MGPPCVLLEIQRGLHNNAIPRRSHFRVAALHIISGMKSLQITVCVCLCAMHSSIYPPVFGKG